jgi:polyphosphate kinase
MSDQALLKIPIDSPDAFFNRELSWLAFARRVLAMAEDAAIPLLERVKFAGIVGMLHDEFFMKRMSGLKRQKTRRPGRLSTDGLHPAEELAACREVLLEQQARLSEILEEDLRPALDREGLAILHHDQLSPEEALALGDYFQRAVQPILTPLAVDSEHPFPFVSNLGLNLAVLLPPGRRNRRMVRVKVPDNRPRWVPLPNGAAVVPLEQIIAANLQSLDLNLAAEGVYLFRVTRGASGEPDAEQENTLREPGSIIDQVRHELKARRFAGPVRLEVDPEMPEDFQHWLADQIGLEADDVYPVRFPGTSDLMRLSAPDQREDLRFSHQKPRNHPRLKKLERDDPGAIFREIDRGDILLHHPYHDFETSVLAFIRSAAVDPAVLAIKLTIYRTSSDSPIVTALVDAVRRGKQVAVLVEITARFDEAPNISWGNYLEKEGVHVAYGVERLKTHVKLAMVVREEGEQLRTYVHAGTGNYHTGTAKMYEDLGVLTSHPELCEDVAGVFNALTGATAMRESKHLLVAPYTMRKRFVGMIRREAEHARAGRPCGIDAKMNQLQDAEMIHELYKAGQAGVPIRLNVRGLCSLRPGVPGLSENIRVFSVVGRFLEHSRVYRFENAGEPEHFIGSADWMKRNLNSRVESIVPILDAGLRQELDGLLQVYHDDNASAWDCGPDGTYVKRTPGEGEERRTAQKILLERAKGKPGSSRTAEFDHARRRSAQRPAEPAGSDAPETVRPLRPPKSKP